jgi:hypothetical protein
MILTYDNLLNPFGGTLDKCRIVHVLFFNKGKDDE